MNPEKDRVELYDIPGDRNELHDVASDHPDIVEALSKDLMAWKENCPPLVRSFAAGNNEYPWPGESN